MRKLALFALVAVALAASAGAETKAAAAETGPRLVVEPEGFDFGRALVNKSLRKDFTLRNIGTEALQLEKVTTTCGCTIASGYDRVIKPGQSTTLSIEFQTRSYLGRVERKVLIRSNDPTRDPLEVKVQATVVAQ